MQDVLRRKVMPFPKEVLLLSQDVIPRKSQTQFTHHRYKKRKEVTGEAFPGICFHPLFLVRNIPLTLTCFIAFYPPQILHFCSKIFKGKLGRVSQDIQIHSLEIFFHMGFSCNCHCPLSVCRWTTYQCGHDVPECVSPVLLGVHSCLLFCPHFTYSMHLFPVAQKWLLTSIMIAYLHACCYELPKLEFLKKNPLKKRKKYMCCKIVLRKKVFH